ncbi:MAG: alanine--tRNA ligase, partial [Chlamydiales bacterium]
NVGHTSRHLTFFEMLGNFSFGDYFKKEAIAYAWEVTTEIFQFDPSLLWITVFHEDDESFELWQKFVSPDRIVRKGEKDNFWSMGEVGPCGPCSELFFDRGEKFGPARNPAEDVSEERYIEFWNLVFMQYNRDASGEKHLLPKTGVDTGGGLERIISLQTGTTSLFETDILMRLIGEVERISGKKYKGAPPFRVIADHMRTLSFAIADGVQPSNVERGYVLRKVLRRAVRYGRQLGIDRPFLGELLPSLIHMMGGDFPELKSAEERINEILSLEEEAFLRTLKRGGDILNQVITDAKTAKMISGDDAFKLKDTYGLPLEEILLLAKDASLGVDINRFEELEHEAKERSKSARKVEGEVADTSIYEKFSETHSCCDFLGYQTCTAEAVVLGIMRNNCGVETLSSGEEGVILLDRSPFYAEKGGQVGDQGTLSCRENLFVVIDCQTPYTDVVAHIGVVKQGEISIGDCVNVTVNSERRTKIARNHTATHLLHYALHQVLGEHVRQGGSIVESTRLRFDFSHHKALSPEEIQQVELLVNAKIRDDRKVESYELSFSEAQKRKEIKQFFGDKYGNTVRVIDIDYSKELCGGTHVTRVGEIGYFRITKESSIAAGVRRIDAVTGLEAEEFAYRIEKTLGQVAKTLKVQPHQIEERIEKMQEENKQLSIQLHALKKIALEGELSWLRSQVKKCGELSYLFVEVTISADEIKEVADQLMESMPSLALLLIGREEKKCMLLARVSNDLIGKKIHAGDLIKQIAPIVEGKGGGKADSAQGGGTALDKIPEALRKAEAWIVSKSS